MRSRLILGLVSAIGALIPVTAAYAADWPNSGGGPGRDGLTTELGPDAADLLWSGGRSSLIAWQPVIEGRRVFMVRQSGWPSQEPGKSPVVAMNLDTGAELWAAHIPFETGDWTTWVAGVANGRVFASRGGNGASVSARLYCLDAATGNTLWFSAEEIDAGAYDGVVFAPDGDPIIASFQDIWRIRASDGSTAWHSARVGSVSGNCGGAVHGDAVYVADAVPGGHAIVRYDLDTGAEQYSSPTMPGFTIQNTPLVGPDGTIYLSRTQNNAAVDYFYAFTDSGLAIAEKWHVPAAWSTSSEFGIGPDGSVYMVKPGPRLVRLDPDTGDELNTTDVLSGFTAPRMAIDAAGRVYCSNSAFATGRLYAYNADLTPRWSVPVTNINIGGPAIGADGTLVVCGVGTDVRAYRTLRPRVGDLNCDDAVDFDDIDPFVLALSGEAAYAAQYPDCRWLNGDCDGNGTVDFDDIDAFVALLGG